MNLKSLHETLDKQSTDFFDSYLQTIEQCLKQYDNVGVSFSTRPFNLDYIDEHTDMLMGTPSGLYAWPVDNIKDSLLINDAWTDRPFIHIVSIINLPNLRLLTDHDTYLQFGDEADKSYKGDENPLYCKLYRELLLKAGYGSVRFSMFEGDQYVILDKRCVRLITTIKNKANSQQWWDYQRQK